MQRAHDSLARLDLNLLLALDALLAERHVTRAAARLGLTQSAASHALARLRTALRDPLLVRGTRGQMVPTPRAQALAGPLDLALIALADAVHGLAAFDPATARRTFHLATGDYAELVLLPRLAARIGAAAPGIDLWIHPEAADLAGALEAGTLDCVVSPLRTRGWPAGCYEKKLFSESFTCVVRADHPAADQRLTMARYCALRHLLVAPGGRPGSVVDAALETVGKVRRIAVTVPHFLVVPHVIATSDLIATLATRVVDAVSPLFELARLAPPIELPRFTMAAVWHERAHHDPAHRWLREQVFAVAAELA